MANTLEYIERAARKVPPDSSEYVELMREYARELNRLWQDPQPLSWEDTIDRDKTRDYPSSTRPCHLPANGTKAWQREARRAGVQPSLIDEAPARCSVAKLAAERIRKGHSDTLLDVVTRQAAGQFGKYDTTFDRALDHLRQIVRTARSLGFYPSDPDA